MDNPLLRYIHRCTLNCIVLQNNIWSKSFNCIVTLLYLLVPWSSDILVHTVTSAIFHIVIHACWILVESVHYLTVWLPLHSIHPLAQSTIFGFLP